MHSPPPLPRCSDRPRSAASPTTSGSDETLLQTTGRPFAIASSGGKPNPSYKLRNKKCAGASVK